MLGLMDGYENIFVVIGLWEGFYKSKGDSCCLAYRWLLRASLEHYGWQD